VGALLLAFAAASYALGCVVTRHAPLAPGVMGTASQMLAGGAVLALASLARGEAIAPVPARAAWAVAYLVLFGSLLAYSAFGWVLKNARPALATSYAYVNPVIALALGVALGGEHFAGSDYAGLGLVLAAVALVALSHRTSPPAPARDRELPASTPSPVSAPRAP
jgi:drug/metabolite transporter (DMT)-like permease